MIIKLKDCLNYMTEEEKEIYQNKKTNDYFHYIYYEDKKFDKALKTLGPQDWLYIFQKLYLITYKAMQEEEKLKVSDGATFLYSQLGLMFTKEEDPKYQEYYKMHEISQGVFRSREVNDDLLLGLEKTMMTKDKDDLYVLLQQHQIACFLRNNRDYLQKESEKSSPECLSGGERTAINCFNRNYEKEKKLVLRYKSML